MYQIEKKAGLPHQQRVIDEANELGIKLDNLNKFINENDFYKSLSVNEQERLTKQSGIMLSYFEVLSERINNF